jgi:Na+/alanine symporter
MIVSFLLMTISILAIILFAMGTIIANAFAGRTAAQSLFQALRAATLVFIVSTLSFAVTTLHALSRLAD